MQGTPRQAAEAGQSRFIPAVRTTSWTWERSTVEGRSYGGPRDVQGGCSLSKSVMMRMLQKCWSALVHGALNAAQPVSTWVQADHLKHSQPTLRVSDDPPS